MLPSAAANPTKSHRLRGVRHVGYAQLLRLGDKEAMKRAAMIYPNDSPEAAQQRQDYQESTRLFLPGAALRDLCLDQLSPAEEELMELKSRDLVNFIAVPQYSGDTMNSNASSALFSDQLFSSSSTRRSGLEGEDSTSGGAYFQRRSKEGSCRFLLHSEVEENVFFIPELIQRKELIIWSGWCYLDSFGMVSSGENASEAILRGTEGEGEATKGGELGDKKEGAMRTSEGSDEDPALQGALSDAERGSSESTPFLEDEDMVSAPSSSTAGSIRQPVAGYRRGRDDGISPGTLSNPGSGPPFPGRALGPPMVREAVLDSVPAVMRHSDIEAVNELIDSGLPAQLIHVLRPYTCQRCCHLPQFTLTMSCCGAVLCSCCVPSPPTVKEISSEERRCPVCQEEPLEPPQSHPMRDGQVHHLVAELKVLYFPQLQQLLASRGP